MPNLAETAAPFAFAPVNEQMDLLEKGAAEIIRASDLRERLEKSRATGRPAPRKGRLRSHRARPASRPHRFNAQVETLPGPRPPGHFSRRRFHFAHRRPHRPLGHAQAAHLRTDCRKREDLHRAGLPHPRPRQDRSPLQFGMAQQTRVRRHHSPGRALHGFADARARGVSQALPGRAAHLAA